MRIVDQAEELAVWLLHRCDYDVVAGFGDWFVDSAAVAQEIIDRRLHVVHTEVCPRAVRHVRIRVEPEFVAAHVKSDIKRLFPENVSRERFSRLVLLLYNYYSPPASSCFMSARSSFTAS